MTFKKCEHAPLPKSAIFTVIFSVPSIIGALSSVSISVADKGGLGAAERPVASAGEYGGGLLLVVLNGGAVG